MNTVQLINQKIAEGKAKVDTCEVGTCSNHELLYRVKDSFICGDCLDKLGELMQGIGYAKLPGGK